MTEDKDLKQEGIIDTEEMKEATEAPSAPITEEAQQQPKQEPSSDAQPKTEQATFEKSEKTCYHAEVKKHSSFKKVIAACLVVSLVGGASLGAGLGISQYYLSHRNAQQNQTDPNTIPGSSQNPSENSNGATNIAKPFISDQAAVNIIKKVAPSVVSINVTEHVQSNSLFTYGQTYEAAGAGSGVIFGEDEEYIFIATNDHVAGSADSIKICFSEDENVPAELVGTDPTSDLAVVKVLKSELQKANVTNYAVATFGDSDEIQMGESVIAIGNALGQGKSSTGGMISATDKEINIDGKVLTVIQTDAAINEGNSGGALVDYNGNVIGINTAKTFETGVEGMGYAIPSNILSPIITQLKENGSIPKPYLGISGKTVSADLGELYQLPMGVFVASVMEGGSAEQAGIQAGDVITDFGGQKVLDMDTLVTLLSQHEVGETVPVHIIRNGKEGIDLTVTIQDGSQVEMNPQANTPVPQQPYSNGGQYPYILPFGY